MNNNCTKEKYETKKSEGRKRMELTLKGIKNHEGWEKADIRLPGQI